MSFKIGSFNIQKFNFTSNSDVRKSFADIAKIILHEQMDIVAIQEAIAEKPIGHLCYELGRNWNYRWEKPKPDKDWSNANEGYAFLWNSMKFHLAKKERNGVEIDVEPQINYQHRHFFENGKRIDLKRPPYIGKFVPNLLPMCEIRLINTHIAFGVYKNVSDMDISQVNLRKKEFQILTEGVYHKFSQDVSDGYKSIYTFLLGDYNLNMRSFGKPPYLENPIEINDNGHIQTIVTVQDKASTLKKQIDKENTHDTYWSMNYDHFSYDKQMRDKATMVPERIDSVSKYCNGDYEEHRKKISDHVPISLDISLI